MNMRNTILTREERDILILVSLHPEGKHLSNSEIGKRLGISVTRVKTLMHQACLKLKAHNRNEAVFLAMLQQEIFLNELFSLDELAEILGSVGSDILREIAHIVQPDLEHGNVPWQVEPLVHTDRVVKGILTNRERDVLVLASRGLTNAEIAEKLYMSTSAVRTFLYRAFTKLGVKRKADAVQLALKKKEISVGDISSLAELVNFLAPLGAESIEKMAQLLDEKLGKEQPRINYYTR